MEIRKQQFEALAKIRAAFVRQERLREFREKGLQASEDSAGDILLEDAAGGRAKVSVEPQGLLVTSGESRTLKIDHDDRGRVSAVTDPEGFRAAFQRDAKGRLAAIERGSAIDYRLDYDANNRVTALHYADDTTTRYRYDSAGRVTDVLDKMP